jgi:hypothetical protein
MSKTRTMSKAELIEAAYTITGGDLRSLSLEKLLHLMTVTQFITDLCLNEVERRGELDWMEGSPVVPYHAEHGVETALMRRDW